MAYPSLEQYNEALQSPQLVILDQELKRGRLKTTGLGLPLALCGGFALTYTVEVGTKKFALRCFHKESRDLERRYQAISARIKQLASPYFLSFEFIPEGIRIQGKAYPIVKMAWAQGRTLAEFLEAEHRNTQALQRLRQSLGKLATYLEQNRIAHGDIQPENLMVSGDGSAIQLIDYDGMFVEPLRGSNATESGQVNFQHPQRSNQFNERLDRFSFLSLDVALQALIASPALWNTSRSEPSAVVFRRNDFLDPGSSVVFRDVIKLPGLNGHVGNLAKVAAGSFDALPSLADFLQGKGVGAGTFVFTPKPTAVAGYQGPYPVCDAGDYGRVLAQVGSRIELIGCIHSVKRGLALNRKPYIFVNFSDWRGQAVKLAIWFDGMKAIEPHVPDQSWVGRWVSVAGLVDPPYSNSAKSGSYTHLSITISANGQIQQIPEQEARFRLRGPGPGQAAPLINRNTDILQGMGGTPTRRASVPPARTPAAPPKSSNQQLLDQMRAKAPGSSRPSAATPPARSPPAHKPSQPSSSSGTSWGSWMILGIFGLVFLRACAG